MSENKVIIVTGASSGIGEATARLFAAEGYRVVLAARRMNRLQAIAEDIRRSGGQALPVPTDVSQYESVERMVQETIVRWGRIDILFNNAGFGRVGWLESLDPVKDVRQPLAVNLLGTIYCSQAVLPQMIEQRRGHIINMSSILGLLGTPTYTVYTASKFGVRGFSQALRREVSIWGIKVSAIYPGGVSETEFAAKSGSQRRKTAISTPRWLRLTAQQVAQAVYRVTQRPKSIVVLPWMLRYTVWLNNMMPSVVDKLIENRFVRREREMSKVVKH